jgi:SAM-dependent methyltransferase
MLDGVGQRFFPARWPEWRMRLRRALRPARLGALGSTRPLSGSWGQDRGRPVDRYYIEAFLAEHRTDIRGRVLEVKDDSYTRRFGQEVESSDVLDIDGANPNATVVADLSAADGVASDRFDCIILTQTLQLIFDTPAALSHVHRILKPGSVVLATVPSVSRIVPHGLGTDYWRFTTASSLRLFEQAFGPGQVKVRAYGNVTTAAAFLAGAVQEDLTERQLRVTDEYFPVVVAIRATKRAPE